MKQITVVIVLYFVVLLTGCKRPDERFTIGSTNYPGAMKGERFLELTSTSAYLDSSKQIRFLDSARVYNYFLFNNLGKTFRIGADTNAYDEYGKHVPNKRPVYCDSVDCENIENWLFCQKHGR